MLVDEHVDAAGLAVRSRCVGTQRTAHPCSGLWRSAPGRGLCVRYGVPGLGAGAQARRANANSHSRGRPLRNGAAGWRRHVRVAVTRSRVRLQTGRPHDRAHRSDSSVRRAVLPRRTVSRIRTAVSHDDVVLMGEPPSRGCDVPAEPSEGRAAPILPAAIRPRSEPARRPAAR